MDSKVLIVSKPIINNIMPLVDFPKNKDIYNLDKTIESIIGEANVAAYILGKYNVASSYTGIIGNDEAGNEFKNLLTTVNVDTKFVETDFEGKTDITHTIINVEKGGFSHIKVNSMVKDLTKFKYDFKPSDDVIREVRDDFRREVSTIFDRVEIISEEDMMRVNDLIVGGYPHCNFG